MTDKTGKKYLLFTFFNDFLRVGQKLSNFEKIVFKTTTGYAAKCYWSGDVIIVSSLGKPSIPTHCTVSVKLTLGGVGVKGIDAKRSSKWVNIIFFTQN